MCRIVILIAVAISIFAPATRAGESPAQLDFATISAVAVQSHGRVAPLDTVARRAVADVTGRERFAGRSAVEVVLSWTFLPQEWPDLAAIKVEHEPLKLACGLDPERRRFSLRELSACQPLNRLLEAANTADSIGRAPTALQRQAIEIANRMGTMQSFLYGQALTLVPSNEANAAWTTVANAPATASTSQIRRGWAELGSAYVARDPARFSGASRDLSDRLRGLGGPNYPSSRATNLETTYNAAHPFRWAWVTMVLAMLSGLLGMYLQRRRWDVVTASLAAAGCLLFLAGFALRWAIAGRAPLSNMYESMVGFAGSIAIFGLIFFILMQNRFVPVVAAALAAAGLILADTLPIESAITTLPPVLRNTIWLTIHVATIILGYGAAALSMGIGHVQLGLLSFAPDRPAQAHEAARLNHFVILVAIVFLTAGIVFGAVWANASWGRYWGWDPKETWSLITLFGYLALLHARYTGWLRDFGMAVASIACFQLVLMTYYGVNYVLGTGLHSYGFGAGGLQWILAYVGAEAVFVAVATLRIRRNGALGRHKNIDVTVRARLLLRPA